MPPAGVPTLIVVGTESWVPAEAQLERYRAVLGDQLVVERLQSQHWLLWNALQATARAVGYARCCLAPTRPASPSAGEPVSG